MSGARDEDSGVKRYVIRKAYGRYFLLDEKEEKDLIHIQMARAYGKYLNGPDGKGILDAMREGEAFTLRFEDELLQVIKEDGRAVVQAMKIDDGESLFRYNPT